MSTSRTDHLGHGIEVVTEQTDISTRVRYAVDGFSVATIKAHKSVQPHIVISELATREPSFLMRHAAAVLLAADRMVQMQSDEQPRSLTDGR